MPTRTLAILAAALAAAAVAAPARAAEPTDATIVRMTKDIFYLAGPECDGRGTGSKGIEKAADYVAAAFKEAGLRPAGTDGYFQPFTVFGSPTLGAPNTLRLTGPGEQALDIKYAAQFMPVGISAGGKAAAGLVFAGYGITAEKLKYDDYAGLDVKGKIVVVLRRTPKADDKKQPFDADETNTHATLISKVENAVAHGAAGVIFVNDRTYGKDRDDLVDYRQTVLGGRSKIPVVHMKRAVLEHALAAQNGSLPEIEQNIDKDVKPQSVALAGWAASVQVTIARPETAAKNVVGTLPGSGPLADETIVIGAHYDHLGTAQQGGSLGGEKARGQVHWGADDNGSGTTGLMELARRFGGMKDRAGRRIVFIAFSGEELGLLGSIHYVKNPTFPLENTAFMLNMDMIGRAKEVEDGGKKKDRLVVYGHGTAEGMEKLVDDANRTPDFRLYKVPGGTGPSDHDSFYRKKIPVLFLFTGTHKEYHRPGDTADKINVPGMKKVVDMAETFAKHFATVAERPKYLVTKGGWEDPTEDRPAQSASRAKMPKLGIMPGNYEEEDKGVLVEAVTPGGAAEKGGVLNGDLIIEIAGKPVKNINGYMAILAAQKAGVEIEVVVMRKDKKVTVKATPKE